MIIMQMRDNNFADLSCAQAKSLKGLFRGPQNRPATPPRTVPRPGPTQVIAIGDPAEPVPPLIGVGAKT